MILDAAAKAARVLPPETAHRLGVRGAALAAGLGLLPKTPEPDPDILALMLAGLKLPNPVGLAAGFDKDAEAFDAMLRLGFGFVECGTVTPEPQPGNPRPRLFRLPADRAVVNRFGFNSRGVAPFAKRLNPGRPRAGVVGANLGANKTSADRAADYVAGLKALWGKADYFTVNISSPNTPGLRDLQGREALDDLLMRLADVRAGLTGDAPSPPLFLKVAPDLDDDGLSAIADSARANGVDALIVSNTTVSRPSDVRSRHAEEAGGLSGRPLFDLSTRMLKRFRQATGGRMPLIGVGGVEDGATAYAKIRAGASAVQLYTALVYEGPGLVRRIKAELAELLRRDGYASVSEAVGADVPV